MRVYQHPTESRTFYAPDVAPSVDASLPILHVSGLDNFTVPQPLFRAIPLNQVTNLVPANGSGPVGLYQGNDFRNAYVPNVTLNGSGQTVALFELDGYYASDITEYESEAGLPAVPLQNISVDGVSGPKDPRLMVLSRCLNWMVIMQVILLNTKARPACPLFRCKIFRWTGLAVLTIRMESLKFLWTSKWRSLW